MQPGRVIRQLIELTTRVSSNKGGVAAVEFAFVAAPFFALVLMVFQLALYHFGVQSLDHATRLAARAVMVGDVPASAQNRAAFLNQMICPHLMMALSCDNIILNVYRIEATSDADKKTGIYRFVDGQTRSLAAVESDPSKGSFCLGGPDDFVFIDAAYKLPNIVSSLIGADDWESSPILMRSTTLVRAEPHKGAHPSC
ncbi:TadE/TadG family type IV pilus assembly protein [Antarcticirhabdus aurantiaca]|uniref:TadE/TadG family type IV pilus assembly protein n=1 Tax=Antarcticirhabdus aurantiaca TaxID=2606717 RepID=UPI0021035E39|nr:TadE/TadG family type IV pilus assembly protein [Antarcticirhabdus aurantiaca]